MKKNSEDAKQAFIRKTYKARAIPHPSDNDILARVNISLVKLWNMALEQCNIWLKMDKGDPNKKAITPISLNFWLTGVREDNPDIGSVSVVLEREMLRRLAGSFSSYFALVKAKDNRARPPQEKDREKSFIALTWTDKSFSVNGDKLTATVGSRVNIGFEIDRYIVDKISELPNGSKIAQVTVSMKDGEYWVSFVCNIPRPEPQKPKGIVGIDLGAGHVALSCSDGSEFLIPTRRPDKYWMKKIGDVEKRVAKCKKGSRAWKKRMGSRRTMHGKYFSQHKDHQRKLAHFIAKLGMTMVVGKMRTRLGLAKSNGTPEQHRSVQNTGYAFRLLIYLREKAGEMGLTLIEVKDPERRGEITSPSSKFNASRRLLRNGCEQCEQTFPEVFSEITVAIPQ